MLAFSEEDNLGNTVRRDGTKHKAHPNVNEFNHYVGKVEIDSKDYFVRTTVQSLKSGETGTHSFFVTNITLYEKENAIKETTTPRTVRGKINLDSISDVKLRYFFEEANNSSKIVDENGEPLVVYHASDADFEAFDRNFIRNGSGFY